MSHLTVNTGESDTCKAVFKTLYSALKGTNIVVTKEMECLHKLITGSKPVFPRMLFLRGSKGCGKTTTLYWLYKQLKSDPKFTCRLVPLDSPLLLAKDANTIVYFMDFHDLQTYSLQQLRDLQCSISESFSMEESSLFLFAVSATTLVAAVHGPKHVVNFIDSLKMSYNIPDLVGFSDDEVRKFLQQFNNTAFLSDAQKCQLITVTQNNQKSLAEFLYHYNGENFEQAVANTKINMEKTADSLLEEVLSLIVDVKNRIKSVEFFLLMCAKNNMQVGPEVLQKYHLNFHASIVASSGILRISDGRVQFGLPGCNVDNILFTLTEVCGLEVLRGKQSVLGYLLEEKLPEVLHVTENIEVVVGDKILQVSISAVHPLKEVVSTNVLYKINTIKETTAIDLIMCGDGGVMESGDGEVMEGVNPEQYLFLFQVSVLTEKSKNKAKVFNSVCNLKQDSVKKILDKFSSLSPVKAIYIYVNPTVFEDEAFLEEQLQQSRRKGRANVMCGDKSLPLTFGTFSEDTKYVIKNLYDVFSSDLNC